MSALIWIFGISVILIIGMVSYRKYELASGRNLISLNIRTKADAFVIKVSEKISQLLGKLGHKIKKLLMKIPDKMHTVLHRVWVFLSEKIDRYFHKMSGRRGTGRGTGKRGAVSLYWQEAKNSTQHEERRTKNDAGEDKNM